MAECDTVNYNIILYLSFISVLTSRRYNYIGSEHKVAIDTSERPYAV